MALASQAGAQALRLSEQELVQRDWTRIRFGLAIGIMAAGIGAAPMLIALLAPPQFEGVGELERVAPGQTILFGMAGAVSGFLLGGPSAYWMYGVRPTFSQHGRRARPLWLWLLLGVAYTLSYAMLTGGIFLPISQNFFLFASSVISVPNVVGSFFDLFTANWLPYGFKNGAFHLFSLWSALGVVPLFTLCAWEVDKFSTSSNSTTSKYGPIVFASLVALVVVEFVVYGPEELLIQLAP